MQTATLATSKGTQGAEYTERLPRMEEWFRHLPTPAALLDGELCYVDARRQANFRPLLAEMRTRWPDEEP